MGNGLGDSTKVVLKWPDISLCFEAFHTTVTFLTPILFANCVPRRVMDGLRIEAATGGQSNTRRETSWIISVIRSCYGDRKKVEWPGWSVQHACERNEMNSGFKSGNCKGRRTDWECPHGMVRQY